MKGNKMEVKTNIFIRGYIAFILLLNCFQIVPKIKKVKTKRIKLKKLLLKHFVYWARQPTFYVIVFSNSHSKIVKPDVLLNYWVLTKLTKINK